MCNHFTLLVWSMSMNVYIRPTKNLGLMLKCLDIIMGDQVNLAYQFLFHPSILSIPVLYLKSCCLSQEKKTFTHTRRSQGYKRRSLKPEYWNCFWFLRGWTRCFVPLLVPLHSGEAQLGRDLEKREGRSMPQASHSHHVP